MRRVPAALLFAVFIAVFPARELRADVGPTYFTPDDVRAEAIKALADAGDKNAVPLIRKELYAPHHRVRCAAVAALGRLGDRKSIGAIIKSIKSSKSDSPWPSDGYAKKVVGMWTTTGDWFPTPSARQ